MTLVKLELLKPESLVTIEQRRKELKQLVKENSFIECTQENYEEAKRRRTALRKGRTVVQNDVKNICSQLAGLSRSVKDAGDDLIVIVQKAEDKQQDSVTVFEDEKERIRQEKIRLEQERKDKLKEEITFWMGEMKDRISQTKTLKDLEKLKKEIMLVHVSEEAQQEFPNDITWSKTQIELIFNNRVSKIELEEQRVEQEKLRKEKEALERKAEQERLEHEKIELKQKAEQEKIQREKEKLEQKLREAEQDKQELVEKIENSGKKEETQPEPEPIQENREEKEVVGAEIIKVWNISTSPNGENCITVRNLETILMRLEQMEKGNQLYIECDEITVGEYEALKEFVGS